MKMRRRVCSAMMALWLTLVMPGASARAQTPERLAALKISIWPEFDRPTVLVMYDGVLADSTNLPRAISVLIPADAQLFVTTWYNPDGTLAPEQPAQQTRQDDGYTRVTFVVTQPRFRVEYYHDALHGAPNKTFDFAYKALEAVEAVTVEIQQPLKATNFSVTPAATPTRTDNGGFTYWVQHRTPLAAGQVLNLQVKYTKTDPHPSIITPATTQPAPAHETSHGLLIFALGALGLAVLGGLVVLQQHALARPGSSTHAKERRHNKRHAAGLCPRCGHSLAATDNFCPQCGTKRRLVR